MRTFVIGDIHGGFLALQQILSRAAVTKDDTLIFLGDYVDGWSQSPEVIEYLIELQSQQKCICIKGNHDDLLLQYLKNNTDNELWYQHGGESTVNAYSKLNCNDIERHIAFLQQLQNYHLDEQNRLFVHAGFSNLNGVQHEFFPEGFYWDRTLWETALSHDTTLDSEHPYYPKRFKLYKEIYIGHTPVTRIGSTVPVKSACVWNMDTGAAFKGPLTIMNIDTKEFFQSDPLNELYSEEKGRN